MQLNLGIAILPAYVAASSLKSGTIVRVLEDYVLPEQELHAVFPSPKFVPQKVTAFIHFLLPRFKAQWWGTDQRAATRQASFSESE